MIIERNLAISVLKLTQKGSALTEDVKKEAKIPKSTMINLLERMQTEDLLKLEGEFVETSSENRFKIAVKAISLGADIQLASSFLQWKEFESIAATALRNNGYIIRQNLRFKHIKHRYEIDVVGCKKPLVVCVDCKDWHKALSSSSMQQIVASQIERTEGLASTSPNVNVELECLKWSKAKFIPVVLVLMPNRFKFCDNVPIVSVLQFQDFIYQLPLEVESLKYFQKEFLHLTHDFQKRSSGKSESRN